MTVLFLLRILLLAAVPARAADAGAALALSYEQAIQRAIERNPDLVAAQADQAEAAGVLESSRGVFDPSLTAQGGYSSATGQGTQAGLGSYDYTTRQSSWDAGLNWFAPTGTTFKLDWTGSRNQFKYTLNQAGGVSVEDQPYETRLSATITQSLLQGDRIAYNLAQVHQALAALDQAKAAVRSQREQVIADTASAYWKLRVQQRLLEIARNAVKVAEEEQRVVHARVESGELAPVERARVDAAVVQAKTDLVEAQANARKAADALLLLIGEQPGQAVRLTTEPTEPEPIHIDVEAVVQAALKSNPDLIVARSVERAAEVDVANARHQLLPDLSATGRYSRLGYDDKLGPAIDEVIAGNLPEYYIGGKLDLPLGNRADRGNLEQAKAALAKATIERQALERSIAQQVREQVRVIETARLKLDLARAKLEYAQQTLDAERALESAGRAIQKDVLEAIQSVDQAKADLEQARVDHLLALIELRRLKGEL